MNNSKKNEAEEVKSLQTTFFYYSNAISTPNVKLTFNNLEKTKLENFDFVHFLSFFLLLFSFFFHKNISKIYTVSANFNHTKQLPSYPATFHSYFELHVKYEC